MSQLKGFHNTQNNESIIASQPPQIPVKYFKRAASFKVAQHDPSLKREAINNGQSACGVMKMKPSVSESSSGHDENVVEISNKGVIRKTREKEWEIRERERGER